MLNKLLKYDLKYMIKNMSVFYILSLVFAITTRVLFSLKETVIISILGQISVGCLMAMLANVLINTMMRSWVGFTDSLYKDSSYLTHTLPVSKRELYESKFIQTFIFLLVGFAVILLSLFITYFSKENWLLIKNVINGISNSLELKTSLFLIVTLLLVFIELFNAIQAGYLGIILGHKSNNNKIAYSVLFGFVTYIVSQGFVLLVVFMIGLMNPDVLAVFTSNQITNIGVMKILLSISIIAYIFVVAIINILCVKSLKKGVDVL